MAKIRFYNSVGSMYTADVVPCDTSKIIAGKNAGINPHWGECRYNNQYGYWYCGDTNTLYDDCYAVLGAYDPVNGLEYASTGLRGFTCSQLLSVRHIIQLGATTLYLNEAKTDWIQFDTSGSSTNTKGDIVHNNARLYVRINGTTYTFLSWGSTGRILDYGLVLATNTNTNTTGYFPFIIMEGYAGTGFTREFYIYFEWGGNNLSVPAKKLYDGYGKPQDQIPVDPSNEPAGGWSNIGELTGDDIDLPDAPDESVTGVLASGFLNIYSPTASQLRAFGGALWTNAFNVKWYDVDSISNLILNAISDPINFIVGLFMLPVTPNTSAGSGIKLGGINVNTVSAPVISKQFVTLDFGSLDISELYASYLDYSYSRLSIYLPYIGTADIDVQEVTGGSVSLQYIIDCFTGACVANVKCVKVTNTPWGGNYTNSTVHSYSGNVAVQLPISAGSFDVMTQGLINVGLGLVSGQPQTVAKGVNDVIQNVGGDATTRGALSSNTGRLCYQTPYLMFTRPIESRPASLGAVHGYSAGVGGLLKNFSGYVECSDVKLDGIPATDTELDMIKTLLHEGVYV